MASSNSQLWRILSEYRTKSVSQSLEELLTNSINIREGIRSTASTSQQHLREFLHGESQRDANFPPILKTEDRDFLGGSFARHTKIRPLDDIDVYLPLDGANLYYYFNGVQQPYAVLSDGPMWNPLLTPRWADGQLVSSSKVINEFTTVLRRRFPQTKVKPSGQAINIRMTHGETDSCDGLGYDVVPCFSVRPRQQGELDFYLIPDGNNGWIRTNPRVDAIITERLQKQHNRLFRKVVKLLKYWNAEHLSGKIKPYFIEISIARVFRDKNLKSESVTSLSFGAALAFWGLQQAMAQGVQRSWISNAPPVYPGVLPPWETNQLKTASD